MAASPAPVASSPKALGEQKVLVIMARFPDVEPGFSIEQMRGKYFDKLDRYLRAVSYGKARVTGKMTTWLTLPHAVSHYRISRHNLSVERDRVMELIQDAADLADNEEDFSRYSMIFISLGAKRADYGMAGLCGYPGMLGWRSELPLKTRKKRQTLPAGVAIYCEEAHVGVVFHDMAHIMGGVQGGRRLMPCLYDHDLQGQPGAFRNYARFYLVNVGYFDPMSCHMFAQDQGPPGPCVWTRLRLGWNEPQKVVTVPRGKSSRLVLGPLNRETSETLAVKLPVDSTTYYLVENRQPIGPDRNLPSHGVLISLCDDQVAECRRGQAPVKLMDANPATPELRGAPFSVEGKKEFQDKKRRILVKVVGHKADDCEIEVSNGL
ncbi:MAG: hypothetical protein HZA91_00295 [Verrucomicrobia bacterium]|nr:hypothetical protein [Verrucomicrobiota bacterium]